MATSSSDQVGTRLLFENGRIRLWELAVAPGETLPEHLHTLDYCYFVEQGGLLRFLDPDSAAGYRDAQFVDNHVAYVPVSEAGRIDRTLTNVGDAPHRNYIIELKRPS